MSSKALWIGDLFSSLVSIVLPREGSLNACTTWFWWVWLMVSYVSRCRRLHPYLFSESALCMFAPWALSTEIPVGLQLLAGGTKLLAWCSYFAIWGLLFLRGDPCESILLSFGPGCQEFWFVKLSWDRSSIYPGTDLAGDFLSSTT